MTDPLTIGVIVLAIASIINSASIVMLAIRMRKLERLWLADSLTLVEYLTRTHTTNHDH
jgi:putative exporter of polyketide antibiotics